MTTCPTPHRNDQHCWFCHQTEPSAEPHNAVLLAEAERMAQTPIYFLPRTEMIKRFSRENRRTVLTQIRTQIQVYFRDKGAM